MLMKQNQANKEQANDDLPLQREKKRTKRKEIESETPNKIETQRRQIVYKFIDHSS